MSAKTFSLWRRQKYNQRDTLAQRKEQGKLTWCAKQNRSEKLKCQTVSNDAEHPVNQERVKQKFAKNYRTHHAPTTSKCSKNNWPTSSVLQQSYSENSITVHEGQVRTKQDERRFEWVSSAYPGFGHWCFVYLFVFSFCLGWGCVGVSLSVEFTRSNQTIILNVILCFIWYMYNRLWRGNHLNLSFKFQRINANWALQCPQTESLK